MRESGGVGVERAVGGWQIQKDPLCKHPGSSQFWSSSSFLRSQRLGEDLPRETGRFRDRSSLRRSPAVRSPAFARCSSPNLPISGLLLPPGALSSHCLRSGMFRHDRGGWRGLGFLSFVCPPLFSCFPDLDFFLLGFEALGGGGEHRARFLLSLAFSGSRSLSRYMFCYPASGLICVKKGATSEGT